MCVDVSNHLNHFPSRILIVPFLPRPLVVEICVVDVLEVGEARRPLAHSTRHPRDVVGHGLTLLLDT